MSKTMKWTAKKRSAFVKQSKHHVLQRLRREQQRRTVLKSARGGGET